MMEAIRKYKDKSHIFVKSKFEKEDGAGWLLLQQLIIAPMSLITTVLLARILSIEDYGFYKYILSVYGIVAIFGLTGFYNISSLNVQRGDDEYFYLGFKYRKLFRWIPAFLSLAISAYYFYMGNSFLATLFLITIFSHLLVDLYDYYRVAVMGRGRYRLNTKLETINYFISFFPPILAAYFTHNLYYVFLTMYIGQFLFRFIAYKYVEKKLSFHKEKGKLVEKQSLPSYKKESTLLSFNGALSTLSVNGSSTIVFNRLGAEANAVYSLAITFADFVYGIISAPLSKALLLLSRMTKNGNNKKEKVSLVSTLSRQYFWLGLLAMLATMLGLPIAYKLFFAKYLFSYKYSIVYSISILSVAFLPAYHYLYEARRLKLLNIIQISSLALGLAALFFSSMYFGLWGAIVVALLLRFANNIVSTLIVKIENLKEK